MSIPLAPSGPSLALDPAHPFLAPKVSVSHAEDAILRDLLDGCGQPSQEELEVVVSVLVALRSARSAPDSSRLDRLVHRRRHGATRAECAICNAIGRLRDVLHARALGRLA